MDELTKGAAMYSLGEQKKEVRGRVEERGRQRQEMKEGLNLTKMNVGSLHLSLILFHLHVLLNTKMERERKKRRYDSPGCLGKETIN